MKHAVTSSKRLPATVLAVTGIIWNILEPAQTVCRQTFWPRQASYETYWNLLKPSAGRCFGCDRHHMKHTGTCSKRLPADVLAVPGIISNILEPTQNVCRQTFWLCQASYGTYWNLRKTSAGRRFGCARHHMKHTGTYAKRLPADVLAAPGII